MKLRPYRSADCPILADLFYHTVHTINARDYSSAQLDVWATGQVDLAAWDRSLSGHISLIAVEEDEIVGFGDITKAGYLDRLYVHKDYQGRGIAAALCDALEAAPDTDRITVHASITAKDFFLRRGYRVLQEQQVLRGGIALTNYVMERTRSGRGA